MDFAANLRGLMRRRGMRAADLARKTKLSEATISDYVNGKTEPRGRQSILLARALGVSLDELWQSEYIVEPSEMSGGHLVAGKELNEYESMLIEHCRSLTEEGQQLLLGIVKLCTGQYLKKSEEEDPSRKNAGNFVAQQIGQAQSTRPKELAND